IARVPVLVGRRLQETERGQVAVFERYGEIRKVVVVVRLVRLADLRGRGRRQVMRVRGRLVELERVVMRNVVAGFRTRDIGVHAVAGCQCTAASVVLRRGSETALEPTPGDTLRIEQVADVLARHLAEADGCRVPVVRTVVECGL